ncbi:MAG: transporter [Verrucomicrobia bacterium]|nr:transporter [Verrucomicrobiota bacterium]
MLTPFDLLVVAFYFCFLIAIGWFFRRAGHDSNEYFRGGGAMTWWMVGSSAFMGAFSAWTFTGAASLAYQNGFVVLVLYWANAVGFFFNWAYFAERCRQSRAVTALETVRQRLGAANEQVFTWLQVPFQILQAGIWLYGLAIFCAPVFGFELTTTIWVCGIVTVFVAAAGGTWAVVAGDFVQALVLVPVTLVAAVTAIVYIGGPAALMAKLPAGHWDVTGGAANFGVLWIAAVLMEKISNGNGLHQSSRYLCVRNGPDARRAALLSAVLFMVGSAVWFIPPFAARAGGVALGTFPGIANPAEMSYVVMAAKCLPAGLMGLLVTGIISSTLSSMDTGLNRNAGIFVRSFYLPVLRPRANERELVLAGRLSTLGFGLVIIGAALVYSTWRDLGVFRLMMNFSALVATPYAIPLFWALLVRRAPDWAAWSTIALCLLVGAGVSGLPKTAWAHGLEPGLLSSALTWAAAHDYIAITLANVLVGSAWFLGAAWLAPARWSPARRAEVEEFFRHVATPVPAEESSAVDDKRHLGVARMCFVYGGFVLVLALLAATWTGRAGLGFCGAFMVIVGALIRRSMLRRDPLPAPADLNR